MNSWNSQNLLSFSTKFFVSCTYYFPKFSCPNILEGSQGYAFCFFIYCLSQFASFRLNCVILSFRWHNTFWKLLDSEEISSLCVMLFVLNACCCALNIKAFVLGFRSFFVTITIFFTFLFLHVLLKNISRILASSYPPNRFPASFLIFFLSFYALHYILTDFCM